MKNFQQKKIKNLSNDDRVLKNSGGTATEQTMQTHFMQEKSKEQEEIFGEEVMQRRLNNTGLPDTLKNSIESLSGYSMDDVKVHYNSSEPAQLKADAFAQGSDIHLATGAENQLAHVAWHVVQQKQRRVYGDTTQMKGKREVEINNDVGLEQEADRMSFKALQMKSAKRRFLTNFPALKELNPIQK
ncbi:DUF4157 domain-containing protein [Sulfurovum sp. bin170]|uniref:eCIS core domain-containing protein n=1 Tax=Sulfurovum sp. bin170 TaxID=2695268 RepID=UPI0013DF838E|nr:DUF4157 domain-containing protein [Sulfurovum sp. bin170]NEW61160.1 DUF4157 domain-containing protein [Sulfurovum sp. bin170]